MATTFNSCIGQKVPAAHNAAVPVRGSGVGSDSHQHLVFVEMD